LPVAAKTAEERILNDRSGWEVVENRDGLVAAVAEEMRIGRRIR
jgi:hypothetical protein